MSAHFLFQNKKQKTKMIKELALLIAAGKAVMLAVSQSEATLKKLLETHPEVNINDLTFRMHVGEVAMTASGESFHSEDMKRPSLIIELSNSAENLHNTGAGIVSVRDNTSGQVFELSADDLRDDGEDCPCENCVARRERNKLRKQLGTTDNAVDFVKQMLNDKK